MQPHNGIVIEKSAGIFLVGIDTSDDCGEMDENVRARVLIKPKDIGFLAQIVVPAAWRNNFPAPFRPKLFNNEGPQKTMAATYHHSPIVPEPHGRASDVDRKSTRLNSSHQIISY